jgi:hypothetical protein
MGFAQTFVLKLGIVGRPPHTRLAVQIAAHAMGGITFQCLICKGRLMLCPLKDFWLRGLAKSHPSQMQVGEATGCRAWMSITRGLDRGPVGPTTPSRRVLTMSNTPLMVRTGRLRAPSLPAPQVLQIPVPQVFQVVAFRICDFTSLQI